MKFGEHSFIRKQTTDRQIEGKRDFDQASAYEQDGLTVEFVQRKAQHYINLHLQENNRERRSIFEAATSQSSTSMTLEEVEAALFKEHENVFYLSSSDGLPCLETAAVTGQRLLTIAASGDASLTLLLQNPASIEMCDISIPGILYNELKLTALRQCSFAQFQEFCEAPKNPFIPLHLYGELRLLCSEQCRVFFDTLLNYPECDSPVAKQIDRLFARNRSTWIQGEDRGDYKMGTVLWDVVRNESEYRLLQDAARTTPISLRRKTVESYFTNGEEFDAVYLSNVGYNPSVTAAVAKKFLDRGAKQVIAALAKTRARYVCSTDRPKRLIACRQAGRDEALPENLPSKGMGQAHDIDDIYLSEMREWELTVNDVTGNIIGLDPKAEFGLMVSFNTIEIN